MLIQFNFKNYRSFRDEASLDLSATKMTEFSDRVVSVGKEKILPVATIYGANASGKSNVYSAFEFMSHYVINSFKYGDDTRHYKEVRPEPFLFDCESEKAESSFEVYFTIPGDPSERLYNYGFCLGENIEVALEPQVLIVSLGAKLKVDKCKLIRDWFLENEFADFGDAVKNFFMSKMLPKGFVKDKSVQDDVVKFFASFDNQIKGFEVTKLPTTEEGKEELYTIDALHKKIDSDEMAKIPLNAESAGTLKMFALYPELQAVLKRGSVLFVDELNARLHPLLVRNIILTFLNPEINVNHAQLIFTTHDTWQLSNQLLRRDEIWFTEKDQNGLSTLYSLADFIDGEGNRIRKDESYEKNYLIGKYGAIPTLETIDFLKEQ